MIIGDMSGPGEAGCLLEAWQIQAMRRVKVDYLEVEAKTPSVYLRFSCGAEMLLDSEDAGRLRLVLGAGPETKTEFPNHPLGRLANVILRETFEEIAEAHGD